MNMHTELVVVYQGLKIAINMGKGEVALEAMNLILFGNTSMHE